MKDTKHLEKQMVELQEKEWELFWKGYAKEYPIARNFVTAFNKIFKESWKKIDMFQNKYLECYFSIDNEGEMIGSPGFWLFLGLMGQGILNLVGESTLDKKEFEKLQKKITREAKRTATKTAEGIAIQSFRLQAEFSPVECPECGHLNPPESCYCNKCGYDFNIK